MRKCINQYDYQSKTIFSNLSKDYEISKTIVDIDAGCNHAVHFVPDYGSYHFWYRRHVYYNR